MTCSSRVGQPEEGRLGSGKPVGIDCVKSQMKKCTAKPEEMLWIARCPNSIKVPILPEGQHQKAALVELLNEQVKAVGGTKGDKGQPISYPDHKVSEKFNVREIQLPVADDSRIG